MNNLSLTACSIWLREKMPGKKKNTIKIMNLNRTIPGKSKNYKNFFEIVQEFCLKYKDYVVDQYNDKLFKVNTKDIIIEENENFRCTYIEVSAGGYGIDADIIDKDSQIAYTRKRDDAEIMKFRVFIAIPKGMDTFKAIILFQNLGQYGVKTITTKYLKKFIDDKLNLLAVTGNICPEVFVKKLLDCNGLKKVIYIRDNVSNDKSDIEKIGYGKEERIITDFININGWKEKISSYLNGNNRIYEFEDNNYTGFKMVTDIYGRKRTIDISNINDLSIIEGIPNSVKNESGNIDDNKLKKHFFEITSEYLEHMVYNKI